MRIELNCRCGASVVLDDPRNSFVDPDDWRKREGKNRVYRVEVLADEWLDKHASCIARPATPTPSEEPTR